MRAQSLAAVLVLACVVGFASVVPAGADGGGTGSPFQPVGPIPHFDSGAFFFFGFRPAKKRGSFMTGSCPCSLRGCASSEIHHRCSL